MTSDRKKQIENWKINLIGVTLGALISLPLVRHVTIPPLPWHICIEFCALMWLLSAPVFIAIGAWVDFDNKRRQRPTTPAK